MKRLSIRACATEHHHILGERLDCLRGKRSGPRWRPRRPARPSFSPAIRRFLDLLADWVEAHGHARVPAKAHFRGWALGALVARRRAQYRRGLLTPEQVHAIEGFARWGWTWDPRAEAFGRALALLLKFRNREGHCRVPRGHVEGGSLLGQWVHNRRVERAAGRLDWRKRRALAAVRGWRWSLR